MERETLVALVTALIEESLENNLRVVEGPQGPRGLRGKDGESFSFDNNKDQIAEIISSLIPDKSELIGERGQDGKKGRDGESFSFEKNKEEIEKIISEKIPTREELTGPKGDTGDRGLPGRDFEFSESETDILRLVRDCTGEIKDSLKLKLSDLSEEEIQSLRGSRGQRGRPGKDFEFEEHRELFESLIPKIDIEKLKLRFSDLTDSDKGELKLNFSDLTEEQVSSLRGPRGQRGSPGKDFSLEENKELLEYSLEKKFSDNIEKLKLKFSDLEEEEIGRLKLKFSDLSEEEIFRLRGSRGQKGKQGDPGKDGESIVGPIGPEGKEGKEGKRGVNGIHGLNGAPGINGVNGERGKDAPVILELIVKQPEKDSLKFILEMSDGSEISSNVVKIPKGSSSACFVGVPSSNSDAGTVILGVSCDSDTYVGAAVYMLSDVAKNAIATSMSTSNVVGIIEAKSSPIKCDIRFLGVTEEIFSGLDESKIYYLSDVTPGLISTIPIQNITGHVVLVLGQPFSSKKFLVSKGIPAVKA